MTARSLSLMSLATAALVMAGCNSSLTVRHYDSRPVVRTHARVTVAHVCTDHCNHYYDGDRVIVVRKGHRHGPGCGHHFNGNRWVLRVSHKGGGIHVTRKSRPVRTPHKVHVERKTRAEHKSRAPRQTVRVHHVHGPRCGHAYKRRTRSWITVKRGHVHGPRCGHTYIEGNWCIH